MAEGVSSREEVVAPLTAADLLRKSVTLVASSGSRSMLSALGSSDQLLEPEAEAHPVIVLSKPVAVTTPGDKPMHEHQARVRKTC